MRYSLPGLCSTLLAAFVCTAPVTAHAAPITLGFDGTITVANGHPEFFFAGLGPGKSFTGLLTVERDDTPTLFDLFLTAAGTHQMSGVWLQPRVD